MSAPDPIQTFLLEAGDLLGQIEEIALELSQRPADGESINRLFRAFHTLKGSGAMFGFDAIAAFTHHIETVLDQVREGTVTVDRNLLTLILAGRDQIQILLEEPDHRAATQECERIVAELEAIGGRRSAAAKTASGPTPPPETGTVASWRIFFRPPLQVAASGLDPVSLLDELRGLGECVVEADTKDLPALGDLPPEQCHVAWRITLTTDRGLNAIKDVFIFVEDESRLVIEPLPATCVRHEAIRAPAPAAVAPAAPAPAPAAAAPVRKGPARDAMIRVPSAKLDQLVNLVGELVMNQSRLARVSAQIAHPDLAPPVEAIERLVGELRDNVLGIRMMPIGSTFSRFKRLVHDLSLELGKDIALVTEGAETELDKTVLDQLGDPLVHLIRNCIDHGICPPEERVAKGKPRCGTIRLAATHAGSHVVIAIQDDGRGLDTDAIRAKAIEKGLIAPDAVLSEKEILNLIFLPGFSTAKQVTNVSGRGVGMDVVKKQIDALRGSIHLATQRGRGTTVSLTLPLTLAIIDGLLVELGGDQFILPMSTVTETVELPRLDRSRQNGRNVVAVRGELIPYIRLREVFAVGGAEPAIEKVVIARHDDQRVGLVVDRVLGSHQTVIQALGRFYRQIEVCSGSTIMGDGRVALILDLPGLVQHVERQGADTGRRAA